MQKLRVGVVGVGTLSDSHICAYRKNPDVELLALCDQKLSRAQKKADAYGIPLVYERFEDMCANPDIDAVSIITWNNSHMPLSIQALEAGKHVLCEKPPALNAAEAQTMARAARANNRTLMIAFVRRFSEKVMLAKSLVDQGDIGDVYYVKTGYLRRCGNPGGWFANRSISGGGPLLDIGVHMIDQGIYLLGHPRPVSVFGTVNSSVGTRAGVRGMESYLSADFSAPTDAGARVEDFANALIRFDNGASMYIETSWTMNIKSDLVYMDIFGDKGGMKTEPVLELYSQNGAYLTDIQPVICDSDSKFVKAFDEEINHFVNCALHGIPCSSPIEDGVTVMKIIDAIYQSAKTHALVRLD